MWSETHFLHVLDKARSGDVESQYLVGCYFLTTGDLASSFEWFRSSAEKEHALAKHAVSVYFEQEVHISQFDVVNAVSSITCCSGSRSVSSSVR